MEEERRHTARSLPASVVLICIGLLPFAGAQLKRANALDGDSLKNPQNSPISVVSVQGIAGRNVSLPCDIKPRDNKDAISVVLWFKGGSNEPVYRYDARHQHAKRATNTMHFLSNRASFRTSPVAHLFVQNLTDSDEGEYRCRVDFRNSPTKNLKVNLTVIVPPSIPKIYDAKKRHVSKHLEAYPEGVSLELVCEVYGGKPEPEVMWYLGSTLIDSKYHPDYYEVRTSKRHDESNQPVIIKHVTIKSLQRIHNHTKLTCEANNTNLTEPLRTTVIVKLNLKPLNVTILDKRQIVSTKRKYETRCRSSGSSPPANLTWYMGAKELHNAESKFQRNGTLSILYWAPSPDDDGKYITCRARNQHLPEATIEEKWKLKVYFAPIVRLKMGSSLNPSDIKEGDDVYFECNVRANPATFNLTWYHKGKELHHNVTGGVVLSDRSMILPGVSRKASGNYTCAAANTEGRSVSNAVHLNVKFAPVCKQVQDSKKWRHRNETIHLICEMDANPKPVSFRWTFNKSGDVNEIPATKFTSEGTISNLNYTLENDVDNGILGCWANNSVGQIREPCQYKVIASGKPYPLRNCTAYNRNESWIRISCIEGFDGGSPQKFVAMVNKQRMVSQNPYWEFEVRQPTTVALYAENLKGPSKPVIINDITLRSISKYSEKPGYFINVSPILIGLGVTATILGLIVIGVLMALWRRHVTTPAKPPQQPILTTFAGKCEEEEGNPDLIPTTVLINHVTGTILSESSTRKNTMKDELT